MRSVLPLAALVIAAGAGWQALAVASPAPVPVRVALFGGSTPPLFLVAQQHRLFQKFGVSVQVEVKWTSQELREGLAGGRFDIVHSLADNAVAVAEDLGVPVIILMGRGGSGGVHLLAQPHIQRIEDLRGQTILVDSPDTGHALALRKILKDRGLRAGTDYTMLPLGQTQKRFEAMTGDKKYAATMAPFTEDARRLGFRSLGRAPELVGPYQVSAVYGRRDWVTDHPEAATGYLAGYLHSARWAADPANRAAVLAVLQQQTDRSTAERLYERALAQDEREEQEFDFEAFKNGLALRAEIEGTWSGQPPDPGRYVDLSFYRKARALLER